MADEKQPSSRPSTCPLLLFALLYLAACIGVARAVNSAVIHPYMVERTHTAIAEQRGCSRRVLACEPVCCQRRTDLDTLCVLCPLQDEEFHVPQTQLYCAGRFKQWNSKITTLPGLYLTALPYASAAEWIGDHTGLWRTHMAGLQRQQFAVPAANATDSEIRPMESSPADAAAESRCNPEVLRSLNILYGLLSLPLFWSLLRALHPSYFTAARMGKLLLATAHLATFPLLFFFLFLFYTDAASLFWTLLAYRALLARHRFLSATLGIVCVAMRQTNVAWVGWMVLEDLLNAWSQGDEELFGAVEARKAQAATEHVRRTAESSADSSLAASTSDADEKAAKVGAQFAALFHPSSWFAVPRSLLSLIWSCLRSLFEIVFRHFGPLLLLLAFAMFVVLNGGSVVVGDKSNHQMVFHAPQLAYFVAFSAACTAANWAGVDTARRFVGALRNNVVITVAATMVFAIAVHFFTMAHPFLLSDNRHYPFYLWKNLFRRFDGRLAYVFIPVYVLCAWVMQHSWSSASSRNKLWQLLWWLVVALVLVPTPLLEFRYFLTPFVLWFLHAAPRLVSSTPRAVLGVALNVLVNAATLAVFIKRPFEWNDGSEARFMW